MFTINRAYSGLLSLLLLFAVACANEEPDASPASSDAVTRAEAANASTRDSGSEPSSPVRQTSQTTGQNSATELAHPHPAYERLQQAVQQYRQIQNEGGWPQIPSGDLVEEGDTTARVLSLRERLAITDDLEERAAAEQDSVYDAQLAEAVRQFQRRHGLAIDGVLGPNTVAAMNTPVEERIAQLERNMEQWQDLPDSFGDRYILVNIPEFRLRAFENGREALQMKVIVGEEYDDAATPTFNEEMDYVIFRPYWMIPHSIAAEEIVPEARGNLDYLRQNNYQIVSHYAPDAEVYELTPGNLARVAQGDLRLRQGPGPENALGLVKFMFPNEHAIYLHDTPAEHLFEEHERDFSHGCIRVERPVDLAEFVLQGKSGWTEAKIEDAMHSGDRQRVDLQNPIPVYILYWTAYADDEGAVQFREDIYGLL